MRLDPTDVHELSRRGNSVVARGAFGEITVAIDKRNRRLLAIKTILPKQCETELDEVAVLSELGTHENICELLAVFTSRSGFGAGTMLCLGLEYAPIDLYTALEWRRRTLRPLLNTSIIRMLTADLFRGLAYIHKAQIIHADVKPGNLLLARNGVIKICDFGLAKRVPKDFANLKNDTALCTLFYRPPELLLGGNPVHTSVDVFSAGCVVAEWLQGGRPLFAGRAVLDQISCIFSQLGTPSENNWPNANAYPDFGKIPWKDQDAQPWTSILPRCSESRALIGFLQKTVALDPESRMTSAVALQHEFLDSAQPRSETHRLREEVCMELLPPELLEPFILSPVVEDDWKVAEDQVLGLCTERRRVLKKLEAWGKS